MDPNVQAVEAGRAHHGRLVVRKNHFRVTDERLIYADHLTELVWEDNTVERSEDFLPEEGEAFVLKQVRRADFP